MRDSFYNIGEATLACASQLWFDDVAAIAKMMRSAEYQEVTAEFPNFIEPKYVHTFVAKEHWIIDPESR